MNATDNSEEQILEATVKHRIEIDDDKIVEFDRS
jgi:hypothetical protein